VFFLDPGDFQPQELASLLRSVSKFIHVNQQVPTFRDIKELISLPTIFTAEYGSEKFSVQHGYIDAVVDFIDRTDTIPLLEEMPDPRFDPP
jgi:hypothetical protein